MARFGFSLATPVGVFAVRPAELWRGAKLVADAAANAARTELDGLARNVSAVADRAGTDLIRAQRQGVELAQPIAARAPLVAAKSTAIPPVTNRQQPVSAAPAPSLGSEDTVHMPGIADFGGAAIAGLKGFQSALFAGQDDKITALGRTFAGRGDGDFFDRFAQNLAHQQEYSQRQAAEHPFATAVGENAGIGASLAIGNPVSAGRSVLYAPVKSSAKALAGRRLVTKPVELASVATVSGGGNAVAENLVDRAVGNEPTLGDAAGAWIGGAAGGLTTMAAGPRAGAASEAFITPLMQGVFSGEAPSAAEVRDRMIGAGIGANRGEVAAVRRIAKYTPHQKGELGERLSTLKTLARLQLPRSAHKRIDLHAGGATIVDHLTNAGDVVEAKFGEWARLSKQQKKAKLQFGDRYRYDHWKASDAAKIAGYVEGTAEAKLAELASHQADHRAVPILPRPRDRRP